MARRKRVSFDEFTAADLTTYGITVSTSSAGVGTGTNTPFNSGQSLSVQSSINNALFSFGSNESEGTFGFWYKVTAITWSGIINLIGLLDVGTRQLGLGLSHTGALQVYRDTTSNVLGSGGTLSAGQFYFIEWKWKINNSLGSGEIEVKVDGTTVITINSGDSQATANAYATRFLIHDGVSFGTSGSNVFSYFDDLYYNDHTGSTFNGFDGPNRLQVLRSSGNGNSSQLTGSDGNSTDNYLLSDETTPNGDTDYVESATSGHKDTYATGDTIASTNTILAVAIKQIVKRTDTDAKSIVGVVRISGTDYDHPTPIALGTAYTQVEFVWELSPATAAAWTKSEVDGAEFGIKVV